MLRPCVLLVVATLLGGAVEAAEQRGVVYVDVNGNGARDAGEPPRSGVAVSNGLALVRTGDDGGYALPQRSGFVFVTRPAGFDAEVWYREGGGDFGLRPRESDVDETQFFLHVSDAHVYDQRADFGTYSSPLPWFLPDFVSYWFAARDLAASYGEELFRSSLGAALGGGPGVAELGNGSLLRRFADRWNQPDEPQGDVGTLTRAAFAELAALSPEFVVSTGDLVLEGNRGEPDAIDRWFRFYRELEKSTGLQFYDTIGNNELAGTENDDFPPDDPRFGRHFFHQHMGPSHYSFDRGRFHFVALDTHRDDPEAGRWAFGRMEPEVAAWLEADLAEHADRVLVVLNHEPFHYDAAWPFEDNPAQRASAEGAFERHGVDYVLSGHTHWGSYKREGGIEHVTAGALSGMRWLLPPELHPRGYRLAVIHEDRLFAAWKPLGTAVIEIADGPARSGETVLAFADARAPYASLEVSAAGTKLLTEFWGHHFARVQLPPATETLDVTAVKADGSREEVSLKLR